MLKMPFTKYGFSFYEGDNWKSLLNEAGLTFIEEKPVNEPIVEFEGNKVSVQSLCVVAEKKL